MESQNYNILLEENIRLKTELAEANRKLALLQKDDSQIDISTKIIQFDGIERQFRTVLEKSNDGIAVVDETGTIIVWNLALETITKFPATEIIGKKVWNVQAMISSSESQNITARFEAIFRELLKNSESPFFSQLFDIQIRDKFGKIYTIQQNFFPIYLEKGFKIGTIIRDASLQRQTEISLKHSRNLYQTLLSHLPIVVWSIDTNGIFTLSEGKGLQVLGLQASEVVGLSIYDIYRDSPQILAQTNRALKGESFVDVAEVSGVYFEIRYTALFNGKQELESVLGVAVEVTEQKLAENLLKQKTQLLNITFENINEGIILIDNRLQLVNYNQQFCQMFGFNNEYLESKPYFDELTSQIAFQNDLSENIIENQISESLKTNSITGKIECSNKVIEYSQTPIATGGFVRTYSDITEKIKAQKAVSESEERYRQLVELSPDAIVVHTAGKIVYANPASVKMLSANNLDDIIGKSAISFVHPDFRQLAIERIVKAQQTGEIAPLTEEKFVDINGKAFDVEVIALPIMLQQKPAMQVIIRDISDRILAQQALKTQHNTMLTILDNIDAMVYAIDFQTNIILFINKWAKQRYGNMEGQLCWKVLQANQTGPCKFCTNSKLIDIQGNPTGTYHWEYQNTRSQKWYSVSDNAVRWIDGRMVRIEVAFDITNRKKLEQQLIEINAMKDKFFSIIAHDLKNPFNTILGFAELLLENIQEYDNLRIIQFVQIIYDASKSGYSLLENLLDWARSQTKAMQFKPTATNLEKLIEENILLFQESAKQKFVELKYSISDNCIAFADANMINTVIRNLVSNAIKFTHKNGTVEILTQCIDNEVFVTVNDSGVGINKEDSDKLFRIDYKHITTGTTGEKGTGLGLILCKEFVEKNGGKIWFESTENIGTQFKFLLPLYDSKK